MLPQHPEGIRDLVAELVDEHRGVHHRANEPRHLGRADALEVVSDRDVENVGAGDTPHHRPQLRPPTEHVEHHPGLRVLAQRLLERELLAPLDVVSLTLHVHARPVDVEPVEYLHRLALEHPCTGQPGEHEVLGELGVGTGGGTDRGGGPPSPHLDGQIVGGIGLVEPPGWQVEDAVACLPLAGDPAQQHPEGQWGERRTSHADQRPSLTGASRGAASPARRPWRGSRRDRPVWPSRPPAPARHRRPPRSGGSRA